MSVRSLVASLNDRSLPGYSREEAMHTVIESKDPEKIADLLDCLVGSRDLSFARTCPREVYALLKTASKMANPEIQEFIKTNRAALGERLKDAMGVVEPKKSFSVLDADGGDIRLNSTAVRIIFPELMSAAACFFKSQASQEPLAKRAKVAVDESHDKKAAELPNHKYQISSKFFPFLEANALRALLSSCGGPSYSPLSLTEMLQAFAAAKLVESRDQDSGHAASRNFLRMLESFIKNGCGCPELGEYRNGTCSLPDDGLTLLAYAISSSKKVMLGEERDTHPEEPVAGHADLREQADSPGACAEDFDETLAELLPSFSCLNPKEQDFFVHLYQRCVITPEKLGVLFRNRIFSAALSECEALRQISVRQTDLDTIDFKLMMQDKRFSELTWKIRYMLQGYPVEHCSRIETWPPRK